MPGGTSKPMADRRRKEIAEAKEQRLINEQMTANSKAYNLRRKKRLAAAIAELSAEGVGSGSDRADQAREYYDNTGMRDMFEKENYMGGRPRKISVGKTMANKMPKLRQNQTRMDRDMTIEAIKGGFGNSQTGKNYGAYFEDSYNSGGTVETSPRPKRAKRYMNGGAVMSGRGTRDTKMS
jgi:hypothetical protein|tara:strand:- start:702 stop:1241 length:540 start_codon:yes stop_codon:yes gene_type:complete